MTIPSLRAAAPPTLLPRVLVAAGLADRYVVRPTALGTAFVAYNRRGVSACTLGEDGATFERDFASRVGRPVVADPHPDAAFVARLDRVLAGGRATIRYDLTALSDFARAVLEKAAEIPPGQVRPYGWVAAEIGRPKAVRAVGSALGHNPVPLLIPCHRVVRGDGRAGEYALGAHNKRVLLSAEGVDPDELERLAAANVRFVGSGTTGIFCHPTCAAARRIRDEHRVVFSSAAAAIGAGYRPCRKCRPVAVLAA